MSDQRDDETTDSRSAFSGDLPPHVDPDDPRPELDEEALDTSAEGDGGPAGA